MQRAELITNLVNEAFTPSHLEVVNESHMHSVPPNSETHFKLVIVSNAFDNLSKVRRHQAVYALMSDLMKEGLHALALHTFTAGEWQAQNDTTLASPGCMGGSKKG